MKDIIMILVVFVLTAVVLVTLDMVRPIDTKECLSWNKQPSYKWVVTGSKCQIDDWIWTIREGWVKVCRVHNNKYRKETAGAVLFARKRIQDARVGGQTVGMETYRLIFTGSELGNIWRQMAEIEKLVKQTWYP